MTAEEPPVERRFGWEGWVLVAALVGGLLVVPLIILLVPPTAVSFRFAYLVLPMFPAVGLGMVAVWAAVRSRQS